MLHNESVNIWSHLLGAIFVIVLAIYTTMFITSHKDYLLNLSLQKLHNDIKNTAMPVIDLLPNLHNLTDKFSDEYEHSKEMLDVMTKKLLNKTHEYIDAVDKKINLYKTVVE
jgi:hypothetical protein